MELWRRESETSAMATSLAELRPMNTSGLSSANTVPRVGPSMATSLAIIPSTSIIGRLAAGLTGVTAPMMRLEVILLWLYLAFFRPLPGPCRSSLSWGPIHWYRMAGGGFRGDGHTGHQSTN